MVQPLEPERPWPFRRAVLAFTSKPTATLLANCGSTTPGLGTDFMRILSFLALLFCCARSWAVSLPYFVPANGDISALIGQSPPTGGIYLLGPGVFYCSNWFKCPTNGAIIGSGPGVTVLIDVFTNGVPSPLIALSDNCRVMNLSISNIYGDYITGGTPASCMGTHQFNLSSGYTNFTGENLILYGGSDTWYNRHTNNVSGVIKNSDLHNAWDIGTAFSGASGSYKTFKFEKCRFFIRGLQNHVNASDVFVSDSSDNSDVRVTFDFCTLDISNSFVSPLFVNIGDNNGINTAAILNFCWFTNWTPTLTSDADMNTGSHNLILNYCNYNPVHLGDHDAGTATASFGTNFMDKIQFGGDFLGPGPSVARVGTGLFVSSAISALSFTNRASAGGKFQQTDVNGKLIDAITPPLTNGGASGWTNNGFSAFGGVVSNYAATYGTAGTNTGNFQAATLNTTGAASFGGAVSNNSTLRQVGAVRFDGGISYATNQNQIKPDFTLPCQLMSTNAAFTFLAPVGIDASLTTLQVHAVYVTNSSGNSTVLVSPPANCHPVPTTGMYLTNVTRFTFECYAGKITNCFAVPVF